MDGTCWIHGSGMLDPWIWHARSVDLACWIWHARSMDLVCQMLGFMDSLLLGQIQALGTKIASVANAAVGRVRSAQGISGTDSLSRILPLQA